MALISIQELKEIREAIGPKRDEGIFEVLRKAPPQPQGGGFTKGGWEVVKTVAGRVIYSGNLNPQEREKLGMTRSDANVMVALEAFTEATSDMALRQIAAPWIKNLTVYQGQLRIPSTANGFIYRAQSDGSTGRTEPSWGVTKGGTTQDGALRWECMGPCPTYQIIHKVGPSTFGDFISSRYICSHKVL